MHLPHRGTLARGLLLIVVAATAVAIAVVTAIFLISGAFIPRSAVADRLVWLGSGMLLFTLGVSVICAFILQQHIAKPVRQLAEAMHFVTAEQKYDTRVTVHSSEEINALAGGFNAMLAEIQRRDQELSQSKERLEKELAARRLVNLQLQRARDEAESANRAKSEFLANMSHEIRTPMSGVLGMTDLVMETALNPEQREYMGMVKSSAESLLSIINDVLDFSKIEAGRIELEKAEFNLCDLISESLRTFAPSAHGKQLELAYDVRPTVPENVIGDPLRMRQVLLNIVANAVKFTERGEVVLIVDRDPDRGPNALQFTVRDTGIGIPFDKRQIIFEPFGQAEVSQTRKYGGTGLGLAISSRLIALMGGAIWVESHVGEGSEFHISLPLPPGKPVNQEAPAFLRGLSALVIDDNLTNRRVVAGMLSSFGMKTDNVASALQGRSGLEAAAAAGDPYRLVVIDGEMPEMDGFQLAQIVHDTPKLAGATMVMLTCGHRQPEQIVRCRELGVHAYLLKPIRRSELLKVVARVLSPSPAQCEATPSSSADRPNPRKLRILAAEDNRVNQRLLLRLLEKEGHEVVIVEDGEAAVEITGTEKFDAVLMDVQMPKLDGLDAARQIRAREKETGGHLAIIALTAHAMRGDRERCLESGMDLYIAKPLDKNELFRALESLGGGEEPARAPAANTGPVTMDISKALERTGGDRNLLNEVCELFLEESGGLLEQLTRSVREHEPEEVCRLARRLKTTVGSIGGERAYEAATAIEHAMQSQPCESVSVPAGRLLQEVATLRSAVSDYLCTVTC